MAPGRYLTLVNASTTVFEFFSCQAFEEVEPTQSYLRRDFSVNCDSPHYVKSTPFAIIMVAIYPIGVRTLKCANSFKYNLFINFLTLLNFPNRFQRSMQLYCSGDARS